MTSNIIKEYQRIVKDTSYPEVRMECQKMLEYEKGANTPLSKRSHWITSVGKVTGMLNVLSQSKDIDIDTLSQRAEHTLSIFNKKKGNI